MDTQCFEFHDGDWHEVGDADLVDLLRGRDRKIWLDMPVRSGSVLPTVISELATDGMFPGLHAGKAMKGSRLPPSDPPRVRWFPEWVFSRAYWLGATPPADQAQDPILVAQEVHTFIRPEWLITLRYPAIHWHVRSSDPKAELELAPDGELDLQAIREEAEEMGLTGSAERPFGLDVAGVVMKTMVASYLTALESLRQRVTEIERVVSDGDWLNVRRSRRREGAPDDAALDQQILALRHLLRQVRWAFLPEDEIDELVSGPFMDVRDPVTTFAFKDLRAESGRAVETTHEITDQLQQTFDLSAAMRTDRLNRTTYALTMVATLLLGPSLIAGIFGMNFRYIPGQGVHSGFFELLLIMAAVSATVWFGLRMYLRRPLKRSKGRSSSS
jgi:hypothetical protein